MALDEGEYVSGFGKPKKKEGRSSLVPYLLSCVALGGVIGVFILNYMATGEITKLKRDLFVSDSLRGVGSVRIYELENKVDEFTSSDNDTAMSLPPYTTHADFDDLVRNVRKNQKAIYGTLDLITTMGNEYNSFKSIISDNMKESNKNSERAITRVDGLEGDLRNDMKELRFYVDEGDGKVDHTKERIHYQMATVLDSWGKTHRDRVNKAPIGILGPWHKKLPSFIDGDGKWDRYDEFMELLSNQPEVLYKIDSVAKSVHMNKEMFPSMENTFGGSLRGMFTEFLKSRPYDGSKVTHLDVVDENWLSNLGK